MPVMLLSHWQYIFPSVPKPVALTIAGHSHCSQVSLPLLRSAITPSAGPARWRLGTSILPVRLGKRPEIVIVTLRPAP